MSPSIGSTTFLLLGALLLPSALASVSLPDIQPIVGFDSQCTDAYGTKIASCSVSDFTLSGNTGSCSTQCFNDLTTLQTEIQKACQGQQASRNSVIGQFFAGNGPQALCGSSGGSGSGSQSTTTSSPSSTTTSAESASTSSSSISSSSVSEASTSATSSSSTSSSSESSTTDSASSRESSTTTSSSSAKVTSNSASSGSSTSTSTSSLSSSTTSAGQAKQTSHGSSGGGSPFDISTSGAALALRTSWLWAASAGLAVVICMR